MVMSCVELRKTKLQFGSQQFNVVWFFFSFFVVIAYLFIAQYICGRVPDSEDENTEIEWQRK